MLSHHLNQNPRATHLIELLAAELNLPKNLQSLQVSVVRGGLISATCEFAMGDQDGARGDDGKVVVKDLMGVKEALQRPPGRP